MLNNLQIARFPNQHSGYNITFMHDVHANVDAKLEMAKLMFAIDRVGLQAFWTQADYEYWRTHVDMMADKNFHRRDTFLFYLNWMGDVWEGTAISPIETVVDSALHFEESL